ncbi:SusC/RagA family TonB-linked outer membrane protein [Butyricimonas faecihominis]|uniref:SusC/RagA family TonB-linked outer membrane protein n=1 Tax=Butyricimonas faecihominis TaxID=1472416 RepID=UPI0032BFD6DD
MKKKWKDDFLLGRKRVRFMLFKKIYVLFVMMGLLHVFGSVQAQSLTLNVKGVTLREVFKEIEKISEYRFLFKSEDVADVKGVTLSVSKVDIDEVLAQCFRGTKLVYEKDGTLIVVKKGVSVNDLGRGQKKSLRLKGFVYDTKKQPLPGVTVKIVGASVGTATNAQGWFSLELPLLKGALSFSFVGFKTRVFEFSEKVANDTIRLTLEEDVSEVDEVIVRAYSTQNKKEVVSSIATITAEEMKELPAASVMSMLQGRLPGLQIVNQSGAPGSAADVSIRGFNSLVDVRGGGSTGATDNQPLYVVDGMPMQSFVSQETGTNLLADLDPSMIESVSVLKDAAAASIYGSRAANGVILITTKRGKAGYNKFSVNASYSVSKILEYPEQTGGRMERWMRILWMRNQVEPYYIDPTYVYPTSHSDAYRNNATYDAWWGDGQRYSATSNALLQDSLNPFFNNQTNWYKYAFRTASVKNINLQASGGSDKFQYMLGAGYYQETGIMLNSSYARANVLFNMSVQPTKEIRIDGRIYGAYVDKSFNSGSMSNNRYEGMSVEPNDQSTLLQGSGAMQDEWLKEENGKKSRSDNYRLQGSLLVEYQLLKGLSFSASGMADYSQSNLNNFNPSTLDPRNHENLSQGTIGRNISLSTEELLRYKATIAEDHNIEFLLGFNATKDQKFRIKGSGRRGGSDYVYYYPVTPGSGIHDYGDENWPNPQALTTYFSDFREKTMLSYFGRIGYNYKRRYLFEFTYRRDGSSTFGEDHRWASFPSFAVGWAFSEEKFIKDNIGHWLSWGKIRSSYGTSGQIFTDEYLAHGIVDLRSSFNGIQAARVGTAIAPNLTWEKTWQYDLGLDLDLFNNRIGIRMDYYYKYSDDLLYDVEIPNLYVPMSQMRNAMAVINKGFEFDIQADIFRNTEVKWRTKYNMSKNWNKLDKTFDGRDINLLVQGKSIHSFYVYDDDGYYQNESEVPVYYDMHGNAVYITNGYENVNVLSGTSNMVGRPKIKDVDGDGVASDPIICGTPLPSVYGGWANEIAWKNFDLSLLFNITLSRQILNEHAVTLSEQAGKPILIDLRGKTFWTKEGDNTDFPRIGVYQGSLRSRIEKVNSVSLKQITLGYNVPKSIAKKMRFSDIRFFLTGENIFYWSNYSGGNPEVVSVYTGEDSGSSYPLPQKWTVGLTLNF